MSMDPQQHSDTSTVMGPSIADANSTNILCHSADGLTEAHKLFVERLTQRADKLFNAKKGADQGERKASVVQTMNKNVRTLRLSLLSCFTFLIQTPSRCFYSPTANRDMVKDETATIYTDKAKEHSLGDCLSPPSSPSVAASNVRPAWPPMPRGIPLLEDYFETFPPTIDLRDDSDSDFEDELDSEEEGLRWEDYATGQVEDDSSDEEDCSCCGPSVQSELKA